MLCQVKSGYFRLYQDVMLVHVISVQFRLYMIGYVSSS
jgi:hypothetical protein